MARIKANKNKIPPPPPEWMIKDSTGKMLSPKEMSQKIRWERKNKDWAMLKNKQLEILEAKAHILLYNIKKYKQNKDTDKDGVPDKHDCQPYNPKKQGLIHDAVAGIGKAGGYVVGEAKSGLRDIPTQYRRQKALTSKKELTKEALRDYKALKKMEKLRYERKILENRLQKGKIQFRKNQV